MKIKKNDTIKVIAGKDRGKTGKVIRAYPENEKVVVEGINLVVRHVRARRSGEKGQKMYFPKPIALAKIMLVCPKCGEPSRLGYRTLESQDMRQKKERFCKKCKAAV
ncbi:MAG: 50S ribosomal protein L24 [Patescibacteria group bacterium]